MTAPNECLQRRVYNVTAMSFTPEELVDKIHKYVPELRVTYKPDSRQNIGIELLYKCFKLFLYIYLFLHCFYQPIHGHRFSMTLKQEGTGNGSTNMIWTNWLA